MGKEQKQKEQNASSIIDRKTGRLIREEEYGQKAIYFLYHHFLGRLLLKMIFARPYFSFLRGLYYNSFLSKKEIAPFVEKYGLSKELLKKNYQSFGAFFSRKEAVNLREAGKENTKENGEAWKEKIQRKRYGKEQEKGEKIMDEVKRNQFVARLSRALGRDQVPTTVPAFDYSYGPQETMYKDLSREQVITMFKEQCERVGTKFVDTTPDKLGETIMAVIEERGNGKVIFPSTSEVEEYKLKELFEKDAASNGGARTYFQWDPAKGREENISNTANADIGITFPYCGIAETATVVQASGEESGRAISLLPETHIAVLYTDTINPRMTQTMENLAERYHNDPSKFPTNICLISGPSRTADIELVTVDGAHGPIRVTYILVNR